MVEIFLIFPVHNIVNVNCLLRSSNPNIYQIRKCKCGPAFVFDVLKVTESYPSQIRWLRSGSYFKHKTFVTFLRRNTPKFRDSFCSDTLLGTFRTVVCPFQGREVRLLGTQIKDLGYFILKYLLILISSRNRWKLRSLEPFVLEAKLIA
jgi:hypothetical protein